MSLNFFRMQSTTFFLKDTVHGSHLSTISASQYLHILGPVSADTVTSVYKIESSAETIVNISTIFRTTSFKKTIENRIL